MLSQPVIFTQLQHSPMQLGKITSEEKTFEGIRNCLAMSTISHWSDGPFIRSSARMIFHLVFAKFRIAEPFKIRKSLCYCLLNDRKALFLL
jgi:hypothetical protein